MYVRGHMRAIMHEFAFIRVPSQRSCGNVVHRCAMLRMYCLQAPMRK
jgi:hypothetical protein